MMAGWRNVHSPERTFNNNIHMHFNYYTCNMHTWIRFAHSLHQHTGGPPIIIGPNWITTSTSQPGPRPLIELSHPVQPWATGRAAHLLAFRERVLSPLFSMGWNTLASPKSATRAVMSCTTTHVAKLIQIDYQLWSEHAFLIRLCTFLKRTFFEFKSRWMIFRSCK